MTRYIVLFTVFAFGCSSDPAVPDDAEGPGLEGIGEETPELGKSVFPAAEDSNAKEDSFATRKGMPTGYDNDNGQVWKVTRKWADNDAAGGMAWGRNSGKSWDEKYVAWVEAMERVDGHNYGETFTMKTPWGKSLPAPAIECAETALFLRSTFASWYGLPFYVEAADSNGRIYLGHFGFRRGDGSRYRNSPNFKSSYRDYSNQADSWQDDGWPEDSRLRTRKLGGSQDDFQPFIGDGARAGTYFDELHLNKRVGYFQVYLLSYFGSVNLASPSNMYNLKPSAIRAGDVLVKRYARTGIGHVYVVKHTSRTGDSLDAELVSGSMPRRQPQWESAGSSKHALTAQAGGGESENYDGQAYASLGGGIKRWRTPVKSGGYWTNIVPVADRGTFVDASDHAAIGARPGTFNQILGTLSPEGKRTILLELIEAAREHLRRYPASCSARTRREDAFSELYDLEQEHFNRRRSQVDAEHRMVEDFALPELVYQESKTCCWNSSNSAMFEIILQKAFDDIEGHTSNSCAEPTPFMNQNGGYEVFKAYAQEIGRGGEWVAWSEDESCPQRNVDNDRQEEHDGTPWCDFGHILVGGGDNGGGNGGDDYEPNDTQGQASAINAGTLTTTICDNDAADWFKVQVDAGNLKVEVSFTHGEGDIDLQVFNGNTKLGSSASTSNQEAVSKRVSAGTYHIKVFPYSHQAGCQEYTLKVTASGAAPPAAGNDGFESNDTAADAADLSWGEHEAQLCDGEEDWFALVLDGSANVKIDVGFTHADGDIDIALYRGDSRVALSQATGDLEKIAQNLEAGTYNLRVYLYGDGAGCQPYTINARH